MLVNLTARSVAVAIVMTGLLMVADSAARAAESSSTSVGVDFSTLDARTHREIDGVALEKAAVLRLIQEGFSAVNVSAGPSVLLSFRRGVDDLLIEARGPGGINRPTPIGHPTRQRSWRRRLPSIRTTVGATTTTWGRGVSWHTTPASS